jgi:hypothetical protein
MDDSEDACPFHPEYDGYGEPPEPGCPDCDELRSQLNG